MCSPTRKSVPNQGTQMGSEIAPPSEQCAPPRQNERASSERALNPGGAGGHPPRLFASGLSLEKAWIPRPGPGGEPPRGSNLRRSQTGPPARGSPVLRTLGVGDSEAALGAQRPGGPACPAGVPISPEKWGERGPGASPLDPRFYGPLVGTRSFWGWVTHCSGRGAVSVPICVP